LPSAIRATLAHVIPGMNAIAFTREVRALSCAPRRMATRTALNTILRDAANRPLLRMTVLLLRAVVISSLQV
jgi:hypothetical protein